MVGVKQRYAITTMEYMAHEKGQKLFVLSGYTYYFDH